MSKTKMLHVRISDEERELLKWKADKAGMSVSMFIRKRFGLEERVVGRPAVVGGSVIGSPEHIESMLQKTREVRSAVDAFASEEPAKTELIMGKTLSTAAEMNAVYQDVEVVYDNPADDPD